jgi:membrane-bound lytic murein transglycosylase A
MRFCYYCQNNLHLEVTVDSGIKTFLRSLLVFTALALFGCYPALERKAQRPEDTLIPVRFFYPTFKDDIHPESLILALKRNLEYLNRLDPDETFHYGPHQFTCKQVRESQEYFLDLLQKNLPPDQLYDKIKRHFLVYRAAGRVGNRKVLFTGYFEPILDARLTRDETFKYPIYRKPDDLVKIDLSLFSERFKGQSVIARIEGKKVLPYYSRYHIEVQRALEGRNLEIAWLRDPIDVAFLHIQGSGRLRTADDTTTVVGYEASNGRPYRSIGRYMLDRGLMEREHMSMQGIRRYLSEHPELIEEVLNHNPSYVFFRRLESGPLGNINVPITPGRSVALDAMLFPKGALCFISCEKPLVNYRGDITGWRTFSRFMLNQDTGGAIEGAGRADIFWGSGPYAEVAAGHLKHEGDLYVLIKKP